MSSKHIFLSLFLTVLFLLAGVLGMKALISSRQPPVREARPDPSALVEVLEAQPGNYQVFVRGTGTVTPRQQISVAPQVGGLVTEISPRLAAGGLFKKGDLLFAIDRADYELAQSQARLTLAQARLGLATVTSQAQIARQQWKKLKGDAPASALVLFEPQLESERAKVAAAQAGVRKAGLDLERTRIHAPFDGIILSEEVDLGQNLRPAAAVARMAGTEAAEVVIALALEELGWLEENPRAIVRLEVGEKIHVLDARMVRRLGEVDPKSRMVQVVLEVLDPLGLKTAEADGFALDFGLFVEGVIDGKMLKEVYEIPRRALRDGERIWLMDARQGLALREVEVLRSAPATFLVRGPDPGDLIILTPLSGAAEGMKLRAVGSTVRP